MQMLFSKCAGLDGQDTLLVDDDEMNLSVFLPAYLSVVHLPNAYANLPVDVDDDDDDGG